MSVDCASMCHTPQKRLTFRIETLGCKSNQYDSQRITEALVSSGCARANEADEPDLYVINTCTVTHASDRKCRQLIRRMVREHREARVFVTGCYATADPDALRAIEGVEGVFGRGDWDAMLGAILGRPIPAGALPGGAFGITGFSGRARALMKIQEGCDFCCAYCIVPHVRGRPLSAPLSHVASEARSLADAGFKEIVLTGIHLGLYGRDLDGDVRLAEALACVAETPGVERVRLSSIEAFEVSERLLDAMQHPKVCPHLHLPLQSGDADVLRRMGRRYTAGEFLDAVGLARDRLDNPAITTDVIVGLPGETEAAFEHTLEVCRAAAFSRMHVFPFSLRAGTRAAEMPDRPHSRLVRQRATALGSLADDLSQEWAAGFVGRTVRVLFEEIDSDGRLAGYTDRYVRLSAAGSQCRLGELAHIHCTAARGGSLVGDIAGP
jgi:threonylcarbamoyladenosine tRNA methylthiotransferase MtaB